MVGTPYSFLNIQAGVTGYQLTSWVNGSANQEVQWSVQSGNIGSVTPDGLYTPPASVSGTIAGILKVTAAVDPTAYSTVYVRVLPPGTIRVVAGNQTSTVTDHLGQVWQPNIFLLGGDSIARGGDYPGWPVPQNATQAAELPVYESFFYTYGDDIVGKFVVPNGNYQIHLLLGQPYNGAKPSGCTFPATMHGPLLVESQYLPIAHNYDFGAGINHQCAVPVDLYMPAMVADNTLEFALRNVTPLSNYSPASPVLSGFEIVPDTSKPHLTIDTQQQTTVAAGTSLQLYAVGWYMNSAVTWTLVSGPGSVSPTGVYTAPAIAPAASQTVTIVAASQNDPDIEAVLTLTVPGESGQQSQTGLQFVPITPCRVADTRNAKGPFGGPILAGKTAREFVIWNSSCNIPSSAVAYSLNFTAVPTGVLGYLTAWPSGQMQPVVSTLNSDGRVKANAAILPAGSDGGIQVYTTDATHLVIDINGYFVPAASDPSALSFYPLTPCRLVDTRIATSISIIGGPYLSAGASRSFPVLSSNCGIPPSASAYSLNFTVVPHAALGYLTVWPSGQSRPVVSTLNAPTGTDVANAAIVPAGQNGEISLYAANDTDVVIDVNGYFAAPGANGLSFYAAAPCRVWDSRLPSGSSPITGEKVVSVTSSSCAPPPAAQALVLNATVVPVAALGYLSLWPDGQNPPLVSTLNALDGAITSNMAIVPVGDGSIDLLTTDPTYPIIDVLGYFAP